MGDLGEFLKKVLIWFTIIAILLFLVAIYSKQHAPQAMINQPIVDVACHWQGTILARNIVIREV